MVGIRWTDCFLGGPPPPRPGLKSDYGTYLRADPDSRAWMHASGAIATKLAPFVALAFWPASNAPWWAAAALAGLGVLQIVTDIGAQHEVERLEEVPREKAIARAAPSGAGRRRPSAEAGARHRRFADPRGPAASVAEPVEPGPFEARRSS